MQIVQAQVGNNLYPLIEGEPLPIVVGETIRVFYAFRYKMPERSDVRIWASLYYYTLLGFFEREERAQTKQIITLEKTLEWRDYSGEIDIVVSEATPDIYGLILELPDYSGVEEKIEDCIEVTAAPGIFDMIGPLLVLGLMAGLVSMMAPMMEEGVG